MTNELDSIAIIGLGLIGASVAKGLRERGYAGRIVGCARSEYTRDRALQKQLVDAAYEDPAEAVKGVDLVLLAMPVLATESIFAAIKPALSADTIVTDAGSTKVSVIQSAENVWGKVPSQFVPGHPIAGSEKSGVDAALANLYVDHRVILTPIDGVTNQQATTKVRALWEMLEANVVEMEAHHHDAVLAATSHLPHLLAFTLVDSLAKASDSREIFQYAAGGFRDFTRIASSDPTMWHDIFKANDKAVIEALDIFITDLQAARDNIAKFDGDYLLGVFTRAKAARDHFTAVNNAAAYSSIQTTNQSSDVAMPSEVQFLAQPGGQLKGEIRVPGDKSISHRSIMLGSLAEGVTEVSGFLEGEDALATLQAFRDMGVIIEGPDAGAVRIHGVGLDGLKQPASELYMGNSGTSMRLLSGILAAQKFDTVLTGDVSLSKRPMKRVADPLKLMGANIATNDGGRPPLKIAGNEALTAIHYDLPMASAQVKSCVLLAGLFTEGETSITEPAPTRDHTERMLKGFGYEVVVEGNKVSLSGGGKLTATAIDVPADISSAAFFMVAASIAKDSDITLRHVGINPTRTGVIDILRLMGANIELSNQKEVGGEPVADIRVQSAELKGITIPENLVPLAIDEFPVLFVAAACAQGTTVLTGAEELRVKESDRIQVMADGLSSMGVKATPTEDGVVIEGGDIEGGEVVSHHDHRIAMSFAVASLRAKNDIVIKDCATVSTSFPSFVELASSVGLRITASPQK